MSIEAEADFHLEKMQAERNTLGQELLAEIYAALPWGHEFRLSNGGTARLVEVNNVTGKSAPTRPPIYPESDSPALLVGAEPIGHGPWHMIFDFELEGCRQDHVEVTLTLTGGGGAV